MDPKTRYSDKGTFLKNGKDRSSVAPILFSLFFIAGITADVILWGTDLLILFVGIVGLAAQMTMLYLIRKNHKGAFEVTEEGIRFPKPRDAFVRFSDIKGFKTEDAQPFFYHLRCMTIETDGGGTYIISNRKLKDSDYVSGDFVKIESAIRERWNEMNR
jgi:hypothetical protein